MGSLGPVSDDTNAPRPAAPSPAALARMAPRPSVTPAPEVPAVTDDHSASAAFGRADEKGKVYVREGDGEREVGSYPGATPEEALQYFARKYDEPFASATLLRQRLDSHDVSAKEIADGLKSLREHAEQPNVVGDLPALATLIGELEEGEALSQARRSAATPAGEPSPKPTRAGGRQRLPEHLPRETVSHPAPCACPSCGGTRLSVLGEDVSEVLEYVPAYFKVVRHVRPRLSCRACDTISQAPVPSLPIERGLPGPALLAHVLVAKYCDHLPLHRQSVIYARAGVALDRSTLADWVGSAVFLLAALAEAIGRHARAGPAIHADDTPVPVLDPGRGRTKTGRLWVVVRDERPWGSTAPPAAFYRYSPDRKGEHADALLGSCRGFLHADAYAGFAGLYDPDPATGQARLVEVACRVGGVVADPAPHRPGRADFPHPVPRARASLTARRIGGRSWPKAAGVGRAWRESAARTACCAGRAA